MSALTWLVNETVPVGEGAYDFSDLVFYAADGTAHFAYLRSEDSGYMGESGAIYVDTAMRADRAAYPAPGWTFTVIGQGSFDHQYPVTYEGDTEAFYYKQVDATGAALTATGAALIGWLSWEQWAWNETIEGGEIHHTRYAINVWLTLAGVTVWAADEVVYLDPEADTPYSVLRDVKVDYAGAHWAALFVAPDDSAELLLDGAVQYTFADRYYQTFWLAHRGGALTYWDGTTDTFAVVNTDFPYTPGTAFYRFAAVESDGAAQHALYAAADGTPCYATDADGWTTTALVYDDSAPWTAFDVWLCLTATGRPWGVWFTRVGACPTGAYTVYPFVSAPEAGSTLLGLAAWGEHYLGVLAEGDAGDVHYAYGAETVIRWTIL